MHRINVVQFCGKPPKISTNHHIPKNIHFSRARGQNLGQSSYFQQWRVQQCECLRAHFYDGTYHY